MFYFGTPSARIDGVICNLLMKICNLSDEDFDAQFVCLSELEAEELVVRLIQELISGLNGEVLAFHLDEIRKNQTSNSE
ncbi:MAG: hypothetical protein NW220_04310 [Leptolyngbyaceae cyanobacterium bins.349]|nr:hypothetical protein [Leptolyngbyaceae cyanobacterium bins.349]